MNSQKNNLLPASRTSEINGSVFQKDIQKTTHWLHIFSTIMEHDSTSELNFHKNYVHKKIRDFQQGFSFCY